MRNTLSVVSEMTKSSSLRLLNRRLAQYPRGSNYLPLTLYLAAGSKI